MRVIVLFLLVKVWRVSTGLNISCCTILLLLEVGVMSVGSY